jgi:hypothetical protein
MIHDLPPETCEDIAVRSKQKAEEAYATFLRNANTLLLENHEILCGSITSESDAPDGDWRKEPAALTNEEIEHEIHLLRFKLRSLAKENAALRETRRPL